MSASFLDLTHRPRLFGLILANQEPQMPLHTPREHWVYEGQLLLDQRLGELQPCLDNGIFAAAPEDYPCSSLALPCHYVNAPNALLAISETLRQLPEEARGLLITDYNQPLIGREDFLSLMHAWEKKPDALIYTRCRNQQAIMPAIIPAELFSKLWMMTMSENQANWLEALIQTYPKAISVNLTAANITMESLNFTNNDWMHDMEPAELELMH